jgi:hypothetical protein
MELESLLVGRIIDFENDCILGCKSYPLARLLELWIFHNDPLNTKRLMEYKRETMMQKKHEIGVISMPKISSFKPVGSYSSLAYSLIHFSTLFAQLSPLSFESSSI